MKKLLLMALAIISFVACGKNEPMPLFGTVWELEQMNGEEINREEVMKDESFTLVFIKGDKGDRIASIGDGNNIFGPVTIDSEKSTIKIGELGMTRMMSKNQKLEDSYVALINSIVSYSQSGDELTLINDKGEKVATYVARSTEAE